MIRERALQVLLILSGLGCLAGLYPLSGAFRDGPATAIARQDQRILGNRGSSAGWSTLAHDAVMIVQGIQYHDLRDDLVGYAIIAVIGLSLIALTPAKQARASAAAA
jgi:hypothetical protein